MNKRVLQQKRTAQIFITKKSICLKLNYGEGVLCKVDLFNERVCNLGISHIYLRREFNKIVTAVKKANFQEALRF